MSASISVCQRPLSGAFSTRSIESDTIPVVADGEIARLIENGQGDWQMLQKKSVSIRCEKIKAWHPKELAKGVYRWTLRYDPFLGYMRGVLDEEKAKAIR